MAETKKYDLVTMGEMMLRFSPKGHDRLVMGGPLQVAAAGAEGNVAAGVASLGLKTAVVTKMPHNELGRFIQQALASYGVSDEWMVWDEDKDARLGTYYYEMGASPRKPSVVYDRLHSSVRTLTPAELPEELYRSARCFHTSGITLALGEGLRHTAIETMKRFKEAGACISFDVNFRENLWAGQDARGVFEQVLPYVDIFFCSALSAQLTFGKTGTPRQMMKRFTEEYPISVVASTERVVHSPLKHSFGSVIYDAKQDAYYEEPMYEDIDVIDRIGSGDSYVAGALYGLLKHDKCRRALEYGNAFSVLKCTTPGDMPSADLALTDRVIASHRKGTAGSELDR